ncbi:hypothetical protein FRC17_002311 [Serendipita sp. 399]|nr:hypothetical protein FRC17_002311 [Serendipita sp. 399]
MRCHVCLLSLAVLTSGLESGYARVVGKWHQARQESFAPSSISTVSGSQSPVSEVPTTFASQSVPTSASGTPSSSLVSSQPTILASETSIVTVPSITLQTSSSLIPTESASPVPNTPAGNRNATLLLGACLAGIGGIILLFVLWINFRRSWYFPWNKRKQRNNPSRWSVYSFREKPQLPLGRQLPATVSTENFAKTNESNDGHSTQHMHEPETLLPPIPEIRIDSPKSAYSTDRRLGPKVPPGLGHQHTRWSSATSHSIYSQPSASFMEDVETAERYSSGEEAFTRRSTTRVTSDSSDNSPFRFDRPSQSFASRSTPLRRTTLSVDDATWKGQSRPYPGEGWRATNGGQEEPVDPVEFTLWQLSGRGQAPPMREVSRFSADEEFDIPNSQVAERAPDEGPGRYGMTPQRAIEVKYEESYIKPPPPAQGSRNPPRGILKTPHYQTTSARLAKNRLNKI